jgi:hypothetical protein
LTHAVIGPAYASYRTVCTGAALGTDRRRSNASAVEIGITSIAGRSAHRRSRPTGSNLVRDVFSRGQSKVRKAGIRAAPTRAACSERGNSTVNAATATADAFNRIFCIVPVGGNGPGCASRQKNNRERLLPPDEAIDK